MKLRLLLATAVVLLVAQSVSFAETNSSRDESIIFAAADTPKVELYITDWCPYCQRAIKFFQARGIPVAIYDIEKDRKAASRKNELDSRRGVPFAVINGKKIHGFSEQMYQRALDGK
jgi:glutaredoxin